MSGIEISHKLDMLIKDAYNVSRTDDNAPWYEETQVKYTTYIDGKEILIDTLPYTPVFKDVSDVSLNIYDLSVNDFSDVFDISGTTEYSRSGIFQSVDGLLHKFVGLKLDTSGNGKSWTKLNNSNSILENSFQVNYGDGLSYVYKLFHPDKPKDELNQDSYNGNWYFDYKNGIVHLDSTQPGVSDLSNTKKPLFTFVKYAGRKGLDKFLSQGNVLPETGDSVNKQIFINTSENIIYRFNDPSDNKSGEWVSLGGNIDIRGGDISENDMNLNDDRVGLPSKDRSEGEIIYDSSKNIFYEASRSKTDVSGNGDLAFRPLGYSFFRDNMEGQPPSPLFFFFELTPFSITINWTNPTQYGSGVTNLNDAYNSASGENSSTVNLEGNIYFPVVNRIMIQIKDLSDNSYKYWGNKESPISKDISGLEHGRVICSKNYPILPMKSGVTPLFGNFTDISNGNDIKIYELKDFANAITLFSSNSTPTNNFLSESDYFMKKNTKTIYPTKNDASETEISKSKVGYEIKIWLENQYKSSTNNMTEADFNVITITTAKDNNNLDLGAINFQHAEPPSDASENILKLAFNNLGVVSSADTVIELKIKDPDKTAKQAEHNIYGYYNLFLNLIQIEFQYANYDSDVPIQNDWKAVKKIYTSNTTTSLSIATPESLTNGVFSFNRLQDENYRYYYIKLNNDYLDVSNNEMKKNHQFRVRYKNSANDQFSSTWKDSNIISIQEPAKVDISSVKMTRYNKFTIAIDGYSNDKVINPDAENTDISNNYAVFLRKIKFNVQYKLGNGSKLQVPSFDISGAEDTEADTSMNKVFITTTTNSNHTYNYTLPAGIYPTNYNGSEAITYYFQAQVANNVYKSGSEEYSVLSDEKFIQIEKPSSLNKIVFSIPQNSNNKIIATINSIVDASRGIISAQTTPGLPTISQYTFESSNLKLLDNDNGISHNNTNNQNTRDDDPSLVKTFTFYDALQGKSKNDVVSLDLKVREYNEYINNYTQKDVSINAVITLPDSVSGLNTENRETSNTNISNNITLRWNHLGDGERGLTIGDDAIKNTIDTFTINITRNSTNNKYLLANIANSAAGFIDESYNVTTNNSNSSNDKTGTTDAVNNIKIDSTMDDSLLWPDTTYAFTSTATNSLGLTSLIQSPAPTFIMKAPTAPSVYEYFDDNHLLTLTPSSNPSDLGSATYKYAHKGVPSNSISTLTTGATGYQITNINKITADIQSNTKTHILNRKNLQEHEYSSISITKEAVNNWVPTPPDNADQAMFTIEDNGFVKYTIGEKGSSFNVVKDQKGINLFDISRNNREDIYNISGYDSNNKGYWFKEDVHYKIKVAGFSEYVDTSGHIFTLKCYYDTNGTGTISQDASSTVILHNTANTNKFIYFDNLNIAPDISQNSQTTNMISYDSEDGNAYSINGIPNLATGGKILLTYEATNYSEYFQLGTDNNVFSHIFSYSTDEKTPIKAIIDPSASRTTNAWHVNNKQIAIASGSGAHSDVTLTIKAKNTYDTTTKIIGAADSLVHKFIYDKPSVDIITELISANEVTYQPANANSASGNGQIMKVPTDFDPFDISITTGTQGTDFISEVFDNFNASFNSKQLILYDGKFCTPKYLSENEPTLYNALTNTASKNKYQITGAFNLNSSSDYSWAIFKFDRVNKRDGNATIQNFVLSFNGNSNIAGIDIGGSVDSVDDNVAIFVQVQRKNSQTTVNSYNPNADDGAIDNLRYKWMRYKAAGASTSASLPNIDQKIAINSGLGSLSNAANFNNAGSTGLSGVVPNTDNIYKNYSKNLAGVFFTSSEIGTLNDTLIFYVAIGIKNNFNGYISKITSFDVFYNDGNIVR